MLLGVVSATTAATAWLMKDVINEVFIAKSQQALFFVAGAVLVIYVARGAASYGQGVILARIGNAIVADGQKRLRLLAARAGGEGYSNPHLLRSHSETGAFGRCRAADLQLLVTVVGRDLLTLIGLIGVMIVQDPLVSGVVLLALPIAAMFIAGLGLRIGKVQKRQVSIGVTLADQLRQIIQGFRVVKAFGAEDRLGARLTGVIEEQQLNADRAAVLMARTQPIVETLAGIAVALVILYGGWRVIAHGATPGAFFSFITGLLLAYDPARRLATARLQLEQHRVGLRLFFEMIDERPEVPKGQAAYRPGAGEIRFEDVSFHYAEGTPVLRHLSLAFEAGKTTALVGGSGSGKSTALSLVLRFWDPVSGRILVDGQETVALDPASLREKIAYVGQDTFLFDGSVRENIAMGVPQASEDAIIAAAEAAQADAFIRALPQGTRPLWENSRGAFPAGRSSASPSPAPSCATRRSCCSMSPPPRSTPRARKPCARRSSASPRGAPPSSLRIRLASVMRADRILVLEEGRLVEQGSHADLLARDGRYARLYRMQTGEG